MRGSAAEVVPLGGLSDVSSVEGGVGLPGSWEHPQCPLCTQRLQSHSYQSSEHVVPGAAAALPRNLSEMQTLRSHP